MNLQNINKLKNQKGFTIVELLIVIVVIGILAAIIIVAYQGVTARANTSNAQSAATSILKKVEAYAAEEGSYPTAANVLSAAGNASKSYSVIGSGAVFTSTVIAAKPDPAATLSYFTCGATGSKIAYWDFTDKLVKWVYAGATTSTTTCSPTTPVTP